MSNGSLPSLSFFVKLCLWATIILGGIITLNLLWLLTIFWSDNYVGEHKLVTFLHYHLYRLPLLLALGLAFWAWWKQQPFWLSGAIFLSNFWSFYTLAAVHILRDQLITPELIRQAPLLNAWVVLAFFCLSIITFFLYWVNRYFKNKQYAKSFQVICIIVVTISCLNIIVSNISMTIGGPLLYFFGGAQLSFLEQVTTLMRAVPNLILSLLAVWFILERRLQYYIIHIVMGTYFIFFTDMIPGFINNIGQNNMLALSSQATIVVMILFYIMTTILFFSWCSNRKSRA